MSATVNVIFINIPELFEEAVMKIYSALGIENYGWGDSVNALGGIYGITNLFGVKIRIEENSYDYEEDYKYTVFIKEDILSRTKPSKDIIGLVSKLIIELLSNNLTKKIATEIDGKLAMYSPVKLI